MEKDIFTIKRNTLSYGRGYVYSLQYHLVWCTKYRKQVLKNGIDAECKKMLYELAEEYKFKILAMEVMPDHIHLLLDCKPQFFISDMIKIMKGNLARQYEYISIHRKLFQGIYKHAGKIRDYNITKKEWVLDGATVMYGSASELRATLEYDFSQEKDFSYKGLSMDEIIHHLAVFVSRLWQIHIFGEGNTRTTAVFFIKYLRTLGFSATNDIFAENAWYFRNALVRANYTNLQKGIYETTEYLEAFLRNLLLNEKNELHNRNLHINGLLNEEKVDIEDTKVDIKNEKVDIQDEKVDIESVLSEKGSDFSVKTTVHIHRLFEKYGFDGVFGRSAVMELLELKGSGASKLLANLAQAEIIEPVSGH